jgi:hypothetical protein
MATTQLTFTVTPDSSFADKTVTLKVRATNTTANDIIFTKTDSFTITIPSGLVQDLNLQAETPASSGYFVAAGVNPGEFVVKLDPFGAANYVIAPTVALEVSFVDAAIGSTPADCNIGISEVMGAATNPATIKFTIETEQQIVIAWLDPAYIGDLETSKLFWQVPAGTSAVSISGYPNSIDVPVPNPTIDGNVEVYLLPGNTDLQRIYKVIAVAGQTKLTSSGQVLQKNAPVITQFEATTNSPTNPVPVTEVGFDDTIELGWLTNYATQTILTSPLTPNALVAKNDLKVLATPGKDLSIGYFGFYDQLPLYAVYFLTVNGMDQPQQSIISLKLKPAVLVSYKYTSDAKTSTVYVIDPVNYFGAIESNVGGVFQLEISQPGGIVELHHPEGVV